LTGLTPVNKNTNGRSKKAGPANMINNLLDTVRVKEKTKIVNSILDKITDNIESIKEKTPKLATRLTVILDTIKGC